MLDCISKIEKSWKNLYCKNDLKKLIENLFQKVQNIIENINFVAKKRSEFYKKMRKIMLNSKS